MATKKKTRARNGAGSVRQRSETLWEGRYTDGRGKQQSVYAPSEGEAWQAIKRARAEITLGLWVEPSTVTVAAWVKAWLADYVTQHKATTRKSYESLMRNHVLPEMGKLKLCRVTTGTVRRLFGRLSDKGLAPGTIKAIKICLSSCFSAAVENKIITSNPCHGAKVKRAPKKKLIFVDRKDFPAFLSEVKRHRYSAAIMILFQTGIRSSEMRGLRWSDLNEDTAELTIARQIIEAKNGPIIQTPKDDEERTIILTPETVSLLKRHRAAQAELRLKYGPWKDTPVTRDLMFRTRDGGIYQQGKLYYTVSKIGKAINIPGLHPHSLRDSYAIAALRAGVDIKTVSNNLGHADTSMTLNKYIEYTDDMGRVAAEKYAQYLRENSTN